MNLAERILCNLQCFESDPPHDEAAAGMYQMLLDLEPYARAREETSQNWKQLKFETVIQTRRGGWLGVWDALCAAFQGDRPPRVAILQPVTLSIWTDLPPKFDMRFARVQVGFAPPLETE